MLKHVKCSSVTLNYNLSLSLVSWTFRNSVVFSGLMFELSKDTLPLFQCKNYAE